VASTREKSLRKGNNLAGRGAPGEGRAASV
jgi:hypothetical protein